LQGGPAVRWRHPEARSGRDALGIFARTDAWMLGDATGTLSASPSHLLRPRPPQVAGSTSLRPDRRPRGWRRRRR